MSAYKEEIIAAIGQKKAVPYLCIIGDRWNTQTGKKLHLIDKICLNLNSHLSFIEQVVNIFVFNQYCSYFSYSLLFKSSVLV